MNTQYMITHRKTFKAKCLQISNKVLRTVSRLKKAADQISQIIDGNKI